MAFRGERTPVVGRPGVRTSGGCCPLLQGSWRATSHEPELTSARGRPAGLGRRPGTSATGPAATRVGHRYRLDDPQTAARTLPLGGFVWRWRSGSIRGCGLRGSRRGLRGHGCDLGSRTHGRRLGLQGMFGVLMEVRPHSLNQLQLLHNLWHTNVQTARSVGRAMAQRNESGGGRAAWVRPAGPTPWSVGLGLLEGAPTPFVVHCSWG